MRDGLDILAQGLYEYTFRVVLGYWRKRKIESQARLQKCSHFSVSTHALSTWGYRVMIMFGLIGRTRGEEGRLPMVGGLRVERGTEGRRHRRTDGLAGQLTVEGC